MLVEEFILFSVSMFLLKNAIQFLPPLKKKTTYVKKKNKITIIKYIFRYLWLYKIKNVRPEQW